MTNRKTKTMTQTQLTKDKPAQWEDSTTSESPWNYSMTMTKTKTKPHTKTSQSSGRTSLPVSLLQTIHWQLHTMTKTMTQTKLTKRSSPVRELHYQRVWELPFFSLTFLLFFRPTILTGVTPEMQLCQEEIFGPVVSIQKFSEEKVFSSMTPSCNQFQFKRRWI